MKKPSEPLIFYCAKCKEHKPRERGQKTIRCKNCNRRMKKRKLAKDGTVVTVRMGLIHAKDRNETVIGAELTKLPNKEKVATFRETYKGLATAQRRGYLKRFWREVFPKDEYPAKQTNWMVYILIEYELLSKVYSEADIIPPERFRSNYEAAKKFDLEGFSKTLKEISNAIVLTELAEEEYESI